MMTALATAVAGRDLIARCISSSASKLSMHDVKGAVGATLLAHAEATSMQDSRARTIFCCIRRTNEVC